MKAKRASQHRTLDEMAAEQLRGDPEFAVFHLAECAKDPEPRVFLRALKQVIESRPGGLSAVARKAQVDRAGLFRALEGPSIPNWSTVTRVLRALRLDISFQPAIDSKSKTRRRAAG